MLQKVKPLEPELVEAVKSGELSNPSTIRCSYWLAQNLPLPDLEKIHQTQIESSQQGFEMRYVSFNPHLTLEFVLSHREWNWDWTTLSANKAFGWRDVLSCSEIPWDGMGLSFNPNITLENVLSPESEKLSLQWHFGFLSKNPSITFQDVWENLELPWVPEGLLKNPNFKVEHLARFWVVENNKTFQPWDFSQKEMRRKAVQKFLDFRNYKGAANPPPLSWFEEIGYGCYWHPDSPKGALLARRLKTLEFSLREISFILEEAVLDAELLKLLLEKGKVFNDPIRDILEDWYLGYIVQNHSLFLVDVLKFSFSELQRKKLQRLLLQQSNLLSSVRFTEEELLENFEPWWDLETLVKNPCFTFRCYKQLSSRGIKLEDYFVKHFMGGKAPTEEVPPFNFPYLKEEQWRLYPSLTRGVKLELAITYWVLTRPGETPLKLPLELVALTASFVIGRIYPSRYIYPSDS